MMPQPNYRARRLFVLVIGGLVLISIVLYFIGRPGQSTLTPTEFSSTYAGAKDTVLPDYRGETNDNSAAAQSSLVIYNLSGLDIPQEVKNSLAANLGSALAKELPPSQGTNFVQISPHSIKCSDIYDCGFSFYLDSPEGYFAYHQYYRADGTELYTLNRQPLLGAAL